MKERIQHKKVKARDGIEFPLSPGDDQLAREASDHVIVVPHTIEMLGRCSRSYPCSCSLSHRRAPWLRRGPASNLAKVCTVE